MDNVIQIAKYQAETISIILSFADILPSGQTITGIPTIIVSVASGYDTNPGNILYGNTTTLSGQSIEQRFRLGIPGTIYQIYYSAVTTGGDTLEKECYLAILPDEDQAVPNWLPAWQSTQLYPYQYVEQVRASLAFTAGRFSINYAYTENVKSSIAFASGILRSPIINYSYSHEDVKSSISFTAGNLRSVVIPYSYSHEDIKTGFAWISGTLTQVVISYSYSHEDIKSSITFTAGSLV